MATYQVVNSLDDCEVYWSGSAWVFVGNLVAQRAGWYSTTRLQIGGGMRLLNVAIPQGSTILTANLIQTARVNLAGVDVNSVIIGEAVDDAAAFSTIADYQARRGTVVGGANDNNITSSVNWNTIPAWTAETEYTSPDITAIIQEIISRAGWVSGNALVLFWDDHAGLSTASINCSRQGYAYDGSTTKAPKLVITWQEAVTEKSSSDTGAGVDAHKALSPISIGEAGIGAENYKRIIVGETSELLAFLTKVEDGAGLETLLGRDLVLTQLGYGIDTLLSREFVISETGSGLDVSVVLGWAKISSDTGAGVEQLGSRSLVIREYATGLETVLDRDLVIVTETGLGVDIVIELFTPMRVSSDGGTGTESLGSRGLVLASETGEGLDELVDLLASLTKSDSGTGLETLLTHAKAVADSGIGTETLVSLLVALNRPDTGIGIEVILGRSLVLTDAGIGYDVAIPIYGRILSLALIFKVYRNLSLSTKPYRNLVITAKPYRELDLTFRG